MNVPRITRQAILIGYDPDDRCVYSEILDLGEYYDGTHVWDRDESVKALRLKRVKGYLFDSAGEIEQEFESVFDLATGIFKSGVVRYADGSVRHFGSASP